MCKEKDMIEFTFQGGRDDIILGKINNRTAHMSWEMLFGKIPFVIYKGTGYWAGKEKVEFTEQDELEFLKEFKFWAETKKI